MDNEVFCKRLRNAMDSAGMRQVDLAEKTGIKKESISHYLSGRAVPRDDRVELMAKALGVTPGWLKGYDGAPKGVQDAAKMIAELIGAQNTNMLQGRVNRISQDVPNRIKAYVDTYEKLNATNRRKADMYIGDLYELQKHSEQKLKNIRKKQGK